MKRRRQRVIDTRGYRWGGFKPWDHQERIFTESAGREYYALLMEMRTGKTPLVIHTAAFLKSRGEINAALIVCPNYLKTEWRDQFEQHGPDWLERRVIIWQPKAKIEALVRELEPDPEQLTVLVMNEEAFSTKRGFDVATRFLTRHDALMAVDEATSISNPKAKRTKNVLRLAPLTRFRRILTGTPVTQGPLDLWAPFRFLHPDILGYKTWFGMRNAHAIMGGFKGKEVLGYVGTDRLQAKVAEHSARVLRSDVKDMPPKLYNKILLPLDTNPQQKRLYEQMRDEMLAEWEDKRLEALVVLSQMLRLSQITGGFIPAEGEDAAGPIPGVNPKIEALMALIAQTDEKVVIFSRFRAEIAGISERLRAEYGDASVVEFHGGVSPADKEVAKLRFADPSEEGARFFVANQASARMGLDLSVASLVVYVTNSFALLDRLQTQDRTETLVIDKGSTTYVDLLMEDTLDAKILEALMAKKKLSDLITGDKSLDEWL